MLQATKAKVVVGLAHRTLAIRQLELQYWMGVFKKFGTLAAFLGGFASTVMMLRGQREVDLQGFNLVYSLTSAGAMGSHLTLLAICTTCNVWGPGKTLTGQGDHSFRVAIALMGSAYQHAILLFRLGTLCYFFASIFAAFCLFSVLGAISISIVFCCVGYFLVKHAHGLQRKLVPHYFSSGDLACNPIHDIAQEMTRNQDPQLTGYAMDPDFGSKI